MDDGALQAKGLHYTMPESLASDEHSSLMGPLVSYKENEVSLIRPQTGKLECLSPTNISEIGQHPTGNIYGL